MQLSFKTPEGPRTKTVVKLYREI